MKKKVSREKFENLLEDFFDLTDQYNIDVTAESLTEYVATKLKLDEEDVSKEYGKIITAAASFNEDEYHNAIDEKFANDALRESFKAFYTERIKNLDEKCATLVKDELMNDADLKIFRKTQGYRAADLQGKYSMLWRYVVREFSKNIADEEQLADVVMDIAMYDEEQF